MAQERIYSEAEVAQRVELAMMMGAELGFRWGEEGKNLEGVRAEVQRLIDAANQPTRE